MGVERQAGKGKGPKREEMLGELSYRGRSLSPDFHLPRHADSLIRQSRAHSMERDSLFVPSMHTSTIVCSALSPWSKTGAFFYPRYPESWRGTACSLPRTGYLVSPFSSYRNLTYRLKREAEAEPYYGVYSAHHAVAPVVSYAHAPVVSHAVHAVAPVVSSYAQVSPSASLSTVGIAPAAIPAVGGAYAGAGRYVANSAGTV